MGNIRWTTVALLGVGVLLAPRPGRGDGAALPPGLRPSDQVACSGGRTVVIDKRSINTPGNGVELGGDCEVLIVDSRIVAGGVGVLVRRKGHVRIRNSVIEGAEAALEVAGNGGIHLEESSTRGAIRVRGNGDLIDGGRNQLRGSISVRCSAGPECADLVSGDEDEDEDSDSDSDSEQGARARSSAGAPAPGRPRLTFDVGGEQVEVEKHSGGHLQIPSPGGVPKGWRDFAASSYGGDSDRLLAELGAARDPAEIRIYLPSDELFESGSNALRPAAAEALAKLAQVLRDRSTGTIHVVGHSDLVGDQNRNQELSEARAVAVMHWLNAKQGIPAELMAGAGMGGRRPIAFNFQRDGSTNDEGRAKNRRIEIRFAAKS